MNDTDRTDGAIVERFTKEEHGELIRRWARALGKTFDPLLLTPPTGFVVNGVFAGFVSFDDAGIARLGDVCCDPKLEPGSPPWCVAHEALIVAAEAEARGRGYAALFFETLPLTPQSAPLISPLEERFGFAVLPSTRCTKFFHVGPDAFSTRATSPLQ